MIFDSDSPLPLPKIIAEEIWTSELRVSTKNDVRRPGQFALDIGEIGLAGYHMPTYGESKKGKDIVFDFVTELVNWHNATAEEDRYVDPQSVGEIADYLREFYLDQRGVDG